MFMILVPEDMYIFILSFTFTYYTDILSHIYPIVFCVLLHPYLF